MDQLEAMPPLKGGDVQVFENFADLVRISVVKLQAEATTKGGHVLGLSHIILILVVRKIIMLYYTTSKCLENNKKRKRLLLEKLMESRQFSPPPPPPHGRGQLIDVLMLQTAEASGRKWFR